MNSNARLITTDPPILESADQTLAASDAPDRGSIAKGFRHGGAAVNPAALPGGRAETIAAAALRADWPTVMIAAAALRADWPTVMIAAAALRADWPTVMIAAAALRADW